MSSKQKVIQKTFGTIQKKIFFTKIFFLIFLKISPDLVWGHSNTPKKTLDVYELGLATKF